MGKWIPQMAHQCTVTGEFRDRRLRLELTKVLSLGRELELQFACLQLLEPILVVAARRLQTIVCVCAWE